MQAMIRAALGCVAALMLTACYDDPFSPYWDRGTYYLRYANNRPVPAVVGTGPGAAFTEITGGSLTVRRDHSYQLVVEVRDFDGIRSTTSSRVFAGTYENDGRTLYLDYADPRDGYPSTITANWRGGRFELVVPGVDGWYGVLCTFDG